MPRELRDVTFAGAPGPPPRAELAWWSGPRRLGPWTPIAGDYLPNASAVRVTTARGARLSLELNEPCSARCAGVWIDVPAGMLLSRDPPLELRPGEACRVERSSSARLVVEDGGDGTVQVVVQPHALEAADMVFTLEESES